MKVRLHDGDMNVNIKYETRGPNGPDIAHLVICHNLAKIHLVIKDILSFLCFVLFLVTADGNYLVVPNNKKTNWFNTKINVTQSWYNSVERFFQFHTLIYLVSDLS